MWKWTIRAPTSYVVRAARSDSRICKSRAAAVMFRDTAGKMTLPTAAWNEDER